jgi:hypothetical protein
MDPRKRLAETPRPHKPVPAKVDRAFRQGLLDAAGTVSPKVRWHIDKALRNGPSRGGYPEAQAHFGGDLIEKLLPTAPIIDTLEVAMPGFKRWLEFTGFADCKHMIAAFLAWAEVRHPFEGGRAVLAATAKH